MVSASRRWGFIPYAGMLLVQLLYAGMALLSKAAIAGGMSPIVFVFYRLSFAAIFLAPLILLLERKKEFPPLPLLRIFLTAFLGDSLSSYLFSVSLKHTTATFASASTNAIPAITLMLTLVLRIEKLSRKKKLCGAAKVLGSIICLTGAVMFALYKGPVVGFINWNQGTEMTSQTYLQKKVTRSDWLMGCFLMLLAHTTWTTWLILQGPLVRCYPSELRLTVLQCFSSSIHTAVAAAFLDRKPSMWALGWNTRLFSVLFCGVATGITFWLMTWTSQKKGPVFAAAFTPFALVVTALYSIIVWKEVLHWGSIGATALLIVGLYLVLWAKNKEEGGGTTLVQDDEETNNANA